MDSRYSPPDRRTLESAPAGVKAAAGATHAAALKEFAIGTVESEYRAIARLSVHLAAMRRSVYSRQHHLATAPQELRTAYRVAARQLEWALWVLQSHLSGDVATVHQPGHAIYAHVDQCLSSYLPADRALAAWVDSQLPADARRRLAEAYLSCLAHAPSRPHPRSPQGGRGYWVAFTFHRHWDQLLDTVDGRPGVGRGFPDSAHAPEKFQPRHQGDAEAAA